MTLLLLAVLTIASDPPRVQLGETAKARLRIEAPKEPRLSASTGRIENLRAAGDGRWEADYLPPDDSVPQLAVISAVAAGEVAWFALPLWGQGDAVVKTRPRARIEVRIGDERYPAVADETGTAVVPVNVPPGVGAAKYGLQAIDLHVPPLRLLHIALDRDKARADREERLQILLFAVTADGTPRREPRFAVRASRGEVSTPRPRAPGVYEATWTIAAGPAGRAKLSAELTDAPGLASEASLELESGPAVSLRLEADRDKLVAGAGGFTVRAVATDAAGNPSTEPLRFETTLGEVRGKGPEVRVEVPPSFGGLSELHLTARPADRAGPSAELALPLAPAEAEIARVELPARALHADGATRYPLRVLIEDKYGNAVADARPEIVAEGGTVSLSAAPEHGAYVATYVAPLSRERTFATIAVRAGSAATRARVDLLPQLRALAFGPRVGFLTNFSGLTSPLAAFEASLRTSRWGPELAFCADVSYALQNAGGSSAQGVTARGHTDWIVTAAGVTWRRSAALGATAWLGAGPQLTTIVTRTELGGLPAQTGVALVPGAYLAVGAERRFGGLFPFAEARASISKDPALPNLRGALRALAITVGYRFELL